MRAHRAAWWRVGSDKGSAVVEFVILAIPLFLPLTFYLTSIHTNSKLSTDMQNLARQAARAYVTSPSEELAVPRMNTVLQAFQIILLKEDGVTSVPSFRVECSRQPCLTPNGRVKVTVTVTDIGTTNRPGGYTRFIIQPIARSTSASDIQIVDAWRSTP